MADRLQEVTTWFTDEFKLLRDHVQGPLVEELHMERNFSNFFERRVYWDALSGEAQMLQKNVS